MSEIWLASVVLNPKVLPFACMDTRTCTSCGETKGSGDFPRKVYVQRNPKPGRCSACLKEEKRRYYEANKARLLANSRAAEIRRRQERPEEFLETRRIWRARNREAISQYRKEWKQRHRDTYLERHREHEATRRARMAGDYVVTDEERRRKIAEQEGKCWHCGISLGHETHTDHLIPLSRGGQHTCENVVISCPTCNLQKATKLNWEGPLKSVDSNR